MRNAASILAAIWMLAVAPGGVAPTAAHSWYPKECCDDIDCAPVEVVSHFALANGSRQLIVTSMHGRALVPRDFPVRDSRDGRMHVCMRPDPDGVMDVMCLFVPPQM
jgi:hypothetical protein